MLNRLPPEFLRGPDDRVIDVVDALMDELYRHGRLICPGHRWLSRPLPSIREHLVRLHAAGHLFRDAASGAWAWSGCTSFFKVVEGRQADVSEPHHVGDHRAGAILRPQL